MDNFVYKYWPQLPVHFAKLWMCNFLVIETSLINVVAIRKKGIAQLLSAAGYLSQMFTKV